MTADPLFARFGREFPAGELLFREGDVGAVMYVIQAGRVRISRMFPTGERTLAVLGAGEFFGEMAILNAKAGTATATAVDPLKALVIDARTFEAMVLGNTEIAVRLIKKLARRLDSANAFIEILLQQDPRIRVILGVVRVADEFGQRREDGVLVPVTAAELAHEIGLTEGEVSEVMARLTRVGILTPTPEGAWLVRDIARLHEFLEFLSGRERAGNA